MSRNKYYLISITGDYTTKLIADWLKFYKADVSIFYTDEKKVAITSIRINNHENEIELKTTCDELLNSKNSKTVFFRRGMISLSNLTNSFANPGKFTDLGNKVKYFLSTHELAQREMVEYFFSKDVKYGKDNGSRANKILNLHQAKSIGFDVPDTLVTTSKKELKEWFDSSKKVITKALDIGMFFGDEKSGKVYQQLTKTVRFEDIEEFNEIFPLTVFQEKIEKILELRIFYLRGNSWASAIISQQHENTKEDCRNYNPDKMNRVVPYNLPDELTKKIDKYMKLLELETGSLDIILAENGKYCFLEVNPSGQFTAISEKCNYNLEREIALNMLSYE